MQQQDASGPPPAQLSLGVADAKIGDEGEPISFVGSFTDPGTYDNHSIEWSFGDDNKARGVLNPRHVYKDDGPYTVTLEITDSEGAVGSATAEVLIHNVPPSVSLGAAKLVSEGQLKEYTAQVTDPGELDTHRFTWEFLPGVAVDGAESMTFSYEDDGRYIVSVEVDDFDGGIGLAVAIVLVQNEPPVVEAGPDQTSDEGAAVYFGGSFTDPGILDTHQVEWDFGDGTQTTNTLTPSHVYANDGEFTVTLTVTDDDEGVASDTLGVMVVNKPPVVEIGQ